MDAVEFRNRAAERAAEDGETVSHAMSRLCCYRCGSGDGMQEYDEAGTRRMPASQQVGYYRYVGDGDRMPGSIYRPCTACCRTDDVGIPDYYEEWVP
ncbi:MAG TPA: hypothetical protein VM537_09260 [Anaerolineae bacterium]|nr:hypothetical protein [Anaerolineae bacterium]